MSADREDEIREQADRLEREGDEMAQQLDKLEGHLDEARSTAQEHREQHVEATVKDPQGGGGDAGEGDPAEDAAGAWAEGEPATVGKSSSEGDSGEGDEGETRAVSADDDSDEKSSGG